MKKLFVKFGSIALAFLLMVGFYPLINTTNANSISSGSEKIYKLTITPGCDYNMLSWDAIPKAEHYFVYRATPIRDYYEPLDFSGKITDTHFKDTDGIESGKQYCYYVVGATKALNEIAETTEVCVTSRCPDSDDCKIVLEYRQDNSVYWVNGNKKSPMETPPVNVDGRLFLVVRYVTDEIPGTSIDWESETKTVVITRNDGIKIELQIGNKDAKIDGKTVQIDPNNPEIVPFISEGRTLLPMRFVAENLGATDPDDIAWNGETKTVTIRFDDRECDNDFSDIIDEWIEGKIIRAKVVDGDRLRVTFRKCDSIIIPNLVIESYSKKGAELKGSKYMKIHVTREGKDLVIKEFDVGNDIYCEGNQGKISLGFVVDYIFCSEEGKSKVYGHGEGGYRWLLFVDDPDECKKLEPDSFWLMQGNKTRKEVGSYRVVENCIFEKIDDKWRDEREISACVKITKKEYSGDIPVLYAGSYTLYPKEISDFDDVDVGTCISITGKRISMPPVNLNNIQITSLEVVGCPCPDSKFIKITEKHCDEEQPYVVAKLLREEDDLRKIKITPVQCESFEVDDCYILSMKMSDDGEYWELVLPPKPYDCSKEEIESEEKEPLEICGTITKNNYVWGMPHLIIEDIVGEKWSVFFESEDECKKYEKGTCVNVIGHMIEGKETERWVDIETIEITNCPCVGERVEFCVRITKIKDETHAYATDTKRSKILLYLESTDDLIADDYWQVKGYWFKGDEPGYKGFMVESMHQLEQPCDKN